MQKPSYSILVVEDDPAYRELLELNLREEGYQVSTVTDHSEAIDNFEKEVYDLVICDLRLPGPSGLEVLRQLKDHAPGTRFILLTALGITEQAVQAIKDGADDYLVKGSVTPDSLLEAVTNSLDRKYHQEEPDHTVQPIPGDMDILPLIGHSPEIQNLVQRIHRVASFRSPILITGENGTGKELVARALHQQSPVKEHPFSIIHIGSMTGTLLDSELFGNVKGAFPGANQTRKGLIEEAHQGTIFLHDIADLPQPLQAKFLRLLQHGKIRRLGDSEEIDVDVRIISATTQDLWARMREGTFREDLLYALNVIHLHLPPLRDHIEDLPQLAKQLLVNMLEQKGIDQKTLSQEALKLLLSYDWLGNIRELETALERAAILAEDTEITPEHLPDTLKPSPPGISFHIPPEAIALKKVIKELTEGAEKELILRALAITNNNRTKAARLLGISHRSLLYKLKDYQLR